MVDRVCYNVCDGPGEEESPRTKFDQLGYVVVTTNSRDWGVRIGKRGEWILEALLAVASISTVDWLSGALVRVCSPGKASGCGYVARCTEV